MLPILRGKPDDRGIFAETDYRLFVHQRMKRVNDKKLVLDLPEFDGCFVDSHELGRAYGTAMALLCLAALADG